MRIAAAWAGERSISGVRENFLNACGVRGVPDDEGPAERRGQPQVRPDEGRREVGSDRLLEGLGDRHLEQRLVLKDVLGLLGEAADGVLDGGGEHRRNGLGLELVDPSRSSPMTRRPMSTTARESGSDAVGPTQRPISWARYLARKLTTLVRPTSRSPSRSAGRMAGMNWSIAGTEVLAVARSLDPVHEPQPGTRELLELCPGRGRLALVVAEGLALLERLRGHHRGGDRRVEGLGERLGVEDVDRRAREVLRERLLLGLVLQLVERLGRRRRRSRAWRPVRGPAAGARPGAVRWPCARTRLRSGWISALSLLRMPPEERDLADGRLGDAGDLGDDGLGLLDQAADELLAGGGDAGRPGVEALEHVSQGRSPRATRLDRARDGR